MFIFEKFESSLIQISQTWIHQGGQLRDHEGRFKYIAYGQRIKGDQPKRFFKIFSCFHLVTSLWALCRPPVVSGWRVANKFVRSSCDISSLTCVLVIELLGEKLCHIIRDFMSKSNDSWNTYEDHSDFPLERYFRIDHHFIITPSDKKTDLQCQMVQLLYENSLSA